MEKYAFNENISKEIDNLEMLDCFGFTFKDGLMKEFKPYRRQNIINNENKSFSKLECNLKGQFKKIIFWKKA